MPPAQPVIRQPVSNDGLYYNLYVSQNGSNIGRLNLPFAPHYANPGLYKGWLLTRDHLPTQTMNTTQ